MNKDKITINVILVSETFWIIDNDFDNIYRNHINNGNQTTIDNQNQKNVQTKLIQSIFNTINIILYTMIIENDNSEKTKIFK